MAACVLWLRIIKKIKLKRWFTKFKKKLDAYYLDVWKIDIAQFSQSVILNVIMKFYIDWSSHFWGILSLTSWQENFIFDERIWFDVLKSYNLFICSFLKRYVMYTIILMYLLWKKSQWLSNLYLIEFFNSWKVYICLKP